MMDAFIRDEDLSLKKDVQGKFYVMKDQEIHRLEKKPLKDIDPHTKQKFFFHLIRLCYHIPTRNQIREENFEVLKNAYIDVLEYAHSAPKTKGLFRKPRLNTLLPDRIPFTDFFKLNACFLFGAAEYDTENIKKIKDTLFEPYALLWNVIKKSKAFESGGYPKMQAKYLDFKDVAEHPFIVERIHQSMQHIDFKTGVFPLNDTFWAFFMILILSEKEDVLEMIIKNNKDRGSVYTMGSFFKGLNGIATGKKLLEKLYDEHPGEWIDEYKMLC